MEFTSSACCLGKQQTKMAAYSQIGFDIVLFYPCMSCKVTVLGIFSNDCIDGVITLHYYSDSIIKCPYLLFFRPKPVNTNEDQSVCPLWQSQLTWL